MVTIGKPPTRTKYMCEEQFYEFDSKLFFCKNLKRKNITLKLVFCPAGVYFWTNWTLVLVLSQSFLPTFSSRRALDIDSLCNSLLKHFYSSPWNSRQFLHHPKWFLVAGISSSSGIYQQLPTGVLSPSPLLCSALWTINFAIRRGIWLKSN